MKLKINDIKSNPNNPRLIKDEAFQKLVKSIQEFPEMLEVREIVVNQDHVILGGNMRYRAAKEAGITELPVKVVDWDEKRQQEFVIKDNVSGGEWDWDILANEWDAHELNDWGLDLPSGFLGDDTSFDQTDSEGDDDNLQVVVVVAESINDLDKLSGLYELESRDISDTIKDKLLSQRKVYVFKQ